jgi:AcrR family transcriptional regulator
MAIRAEQEPEGKGAQTRRAILQAAITRFGRDGYRATSVAHIARDAGVGPTLAYAYFPNKEALFLAAVDEDAAGVIQEGLATVLDVPDVRRWHDTLILTPIFTLVEALVRHALARRLLAGLEPDVTVRVLEIPALNELRKACTELLRTGQAAETVRPRHRPRRGRQRQHRLDAVGPDVGPDVGHPARERGDGGELPRGHRRVRGPRASGAAGIGARRVGPGPEGTGRGRFMTLTLTLNFLR